MNAHAIALPEPQFQGLRVKRAIGYLLAFAGLVWVFYDIRPRQLLSVMSITNWWLIAASVFFDVLTYVLQGVRWRLLLTPVGRLRPLRATQAIYAGLFTNEVVPLRFGEVVRAFLVSRWLGSGVGAVVPSMIVERFLDALWLVAGMVLAAMFVPLPNNLVKAADLLGAAVLMATIVFVCIVLRKKRELERGPGEQAQKWDAPTTLSSIVSRVSRLARGLCEIAVSRSLYFAVALSAAMLACQALAIWFIMLAFGLKLGVLAGAVVVLIVRLGTAIPNAPANVGSCQFFTVLALGLFGVEKTAAAAFSIIDFFILTAPLWVVGLFALSRTGMGLGDIRAKIGSLR